MRETKQTPREASASHSILLMLALALTAALGAAGASATYLPSVSSTTDPKGRLLDPPPVALQTASPLRLIVNIPAYRLDAFVDGELVATFPVTVGSARNPTPPGYYHIETMIWNPWWHPPAHRRPRDRVTPPGVRNPMGRVKIHFADLFYFHGTVLENEIGRPTSRGCIRLRNEDAIALARMINEHAGQPLSASEQERLERQPRRTQNVRLPVSVPVTLLYQAVEVRIGVVHVHQDIYRAAARPLPELVVEALAEAGISRTEVDLEAVAAILEGPRPLSFPVEEALRTLSPLERWSERSWDSRQEPPGPRR